jgi:hypothetical protein
MENIINSGVPLEERVRRAVDSIERKLDRIGRASASEEARSRAVRFSLELHEVSEDDYVRHIVG